MSFRFSYLEENGVEISSQFSVPSSRFPVLGN